jgi:hypothetical protein
MATTNSISQQLLDLLATRNYHPEMLDRMGNPPTQKMPKHSHLITSLVQARTMVQWLLCWISDNEMKIMYGDNLGRTMEGDDKVRVL